jgi:hypothetical protein
MHADPSVTITVPHIDDGRVSFLGGVTEYVKLRLFYLGVFGK